MAKHCQEQGYAGIKGNPLESRTWPADESAVQSSLAGIAAIRQAVGDEFDIMLDAHGSPTPELSISLARQVAPYRPLFFEEPVKPGSVEALLAVTQASAVPIATDEKIFTLREFEPLIERRACAVLQPDVTHCFGMTTLVEIARRAEHAQMQMAPHNVAGPVDYAATLHADAVMNNFLIQETTKGYIEAYGKCAEHDFVVEDGYIGLSDKPGLGIEVKETDLADLPYESIAYRQYRHADGSWKGW